MKTKLLLFILLLIGADTFAQYTTIPDSNFEKKLIALGIDDAADGQVATSKINTVISLDVSNSSIVDLTGIQDFAMLNALYCNNNKLKSLDLSKNTALTTFKCTYNQLPELDLSNNIALTKLDCGHNNIKTIDLSKNINLTFLDCESNVLETFDVSSNTALEYLVCGNNGGGNIFSSLDLSKNIKLIELNIRQLNIANLDIKNNIALKQINCSSNNLSALDLSMNTALQILVCSNNKLTALNLDANTALKDLDCSYNELTSLDISKNSALFFINCSSNKLKSLNLKNGNNTNFVKTHGIYFKYFDGNLGSNHNFSVKNNFDLSCITVDNLTYSNTNWSDIKEAVTSYSDYECSTVTLIPDATFEDKLIALGIDTDNKKGLILNSSISGLTSLDISNSSITNLTGIQGFTSLTDLNCSANSLTVLDLSKNSALTALNCSNNPALTCIQVADVALAANNWTTSKDAIANFNVDCRPFTMIPDYKFEAKLLALGIDDVADGRVLTSRINTVTSLNVSYSAIESLAGIEDFTALTNLRCDSNRLTSLNVSKNLALTFLDCDSNQLTSLDVSKNTALNYLYCYVNKISTLDVSKNIALTSLDCHSNILTSLNLKNGKNTLLVTNNLNLSKNPDLLCITVDDVDYANLNWADKKNAAASFLTYDCSAITYIPDPKFEEKLIDLGIDTDGKNGLVLNSSIGALTTLDVSSASITDLSGIQGFTALENLNCSNTLLQNLDLSQNGSLTTLNCSNIASLTCIQVADVDATSNWAVTKDAAANFSIDCRPFTLIPDTNFEAKLIALGIDDTADGKVLTSKINTIKTLDVSSSSIKDLTGIQDFTALTDLQCYSNAIGTLDISKNINLINLDCDTNQLSSLDVSKNTALTNLSAERNKLTSLDVSKNTSIAKLYVNSNMLSSIDLSTNTALTNLELYSNSLTSLDLSKNTALTTLDLYSNKLNALDITNNTSLKNLNLALNQLTALDVNKNSNLIALNCSSNQISMLDFSQNANLQHLNCDFNRLTDLNLEANTQLVYLNCSYNKLSKLDLSKNLALKGLICSGNTYKSIDLSKQTALVGISCSSSVLTNLNLKNNNNSKLLKQFTFWNGNSGYGVATSFKNCPNLTCILVDDINYSNTNWSDIKDATANYNIDCTAYTLIPDPYFEQALIDLGIDTDGKNGKVITDSINTITSLDVNRTGITDLTGIQDFTMLQSLSVYNNNLISLDVSKNLNLITLECMSTALTALDVSKNIALENLYCYSNELTTLDVSKNINLKVLDCHFNNLTTLNLKNGFNTNFTTLDLSSRVNLSCILVDDEIYSNANWANYKDLNSRYSNNCGAFTIIPDINFEQELINLGIDSDGQNGKVLTSSIAVIKDLNVQLSEIKDLSGIEDFASLEYLNCQFNSLTALNVSKNSKLIELYCHGNLLTALNVSANTALTTLQCNKNDIEELDLSKNIVLIDINASENNLKTINLKNGNNVNFNSAFLFKNSSLTCIQVDNAAFANTSGAFFKDDTALYSETCSLGIEDSQFSKAQVYPNPTKGEVNILNITLEKAAVYNVSGQLVKIFTLDSANTNHTINLSGLPKGVYFVYLINQDAASAKKIIIE